MKTSKKQLRHEKETIEGLINRYGNISLFDAHDNVSVALDYYRGKGANLKKNNCNSEKEFQAWMA